MVNDKKQLEASELIGQVQRVTTKLCCRLDPAAALALMPMNESLYEMGRDICAPFKWVS